MGLKSSILPIFLFSIALPVHPYEVKIRGFIEADILSLEQVGQKEEKVDRSLHSGIERLELKLYGHLGKLESKVKLDLDNRSLGKKYNLFEEAILSYQLSPRFKIRMGKGLVPFHRKHWGVLKRSYHDSGFEIDPLHSWRDQDKKILLSLIYGDGRSGAVNSFTLWGNSSRPVYEDDGGLKFVGTKEKRQLSYDNHITFDTNEEQGIANKLEFLFNRTHSLSFAGIAYNNKWSPHWSYAVDASYGYHAEKREVWFEYTHGITSTHWGAKHAVHRNKEHLFQLGFEQYLNSRLNVLANAEYAKVDRQNHSGELGNTGNNDGLFYDVDTFKLETGIKYKILDQKSYLTLGVFYEQQNKVRGGLSLPKRSAFQLANTLTVWF